MNAIADAPPIHGQPQGTSWEAYRQMGSDLLNIIIRKQLVPHFQPILDLRTGSVFGFEGLIRGPSATVLHSPVNLFNVARYTGLSGELEEACCSALMTEYARHSLATKLFLNIGPAAFAKSASKGPIVMEELRKLGLSPSQIIIELTESEPSLELEPLLKAAEYFRSLGFAIALDDLGEGFSSLRLWSELRPDYVKIDKHFVRGVGFDPVKQQFLRSIRELAMGTNARVVAEGVETESDLAIVADLGLDFVQGYLLGRPAPVPVFAQVAKRIIPDSAPNTTDDAHGCCSRQVRVTASHLIQSLSPVTPETPVASVVERFRREPGLLTLPVVKAGRPVGLINRYAFLDRMAHPFARDLNGKKACSQFMEVCPLVVDHRTAIQELSRLVVDADPRHILFGFIVTKDGYYLGVGSGQELMREITRMQIQAARYANPLTLLPGNVPIHEHLDDLLEQNVPFLVGYCDLDHFKPYNDVYGYRKGDEVIQWTAKLLCQACDPESDFLGHIGGDDFILVLRSKDGLARMERALEIFAQERVRFFAAEDQQRGGYETEDRQGRTVFHPMVGLSIGVLQVKAGVFESHHDISTAASQAKKVAKSQEGCSIFVDRRTKTINCHECAV